MIKSSELQPIDKQQASGKSKTLRIAYAIQNVGGIDFSLDVGDTVPVKQTLFGLRRVGHEVRCLRLVGNSVVAVDDVTDPDKFWPIQMGLTASRPFRLFESGVRRVQRALRLPYFANFDNFRFYEVSLRCLPHYDVCHEHNGLFGIGAALACERLGLPYVLTFSADPLFEHDLIGKPLRGIHAQVAAWEAKFTYKVASRIICVSEPAKQHLIDNWQVDPEKIAVMPNGVDIGVFGANHGSQATRAELSLGDAPVVCFVGGFQLWHGIEQLIESFGKVLSEVPQAKLLLVGDGPARPGVERQIAKLGLEPAVIITGMVPQVRVPELLATADVAVIPYPQLPKELWFSPLKLYEYMAAGKAIVASRSGQIAEVIKHGHNGLLVTSGDVDGFTQAIIRLLNNPAERERLGQNARKQAVEQHSWERYIKRLENIYLSVL